MLHLQVFISQTKGENLQLLESKVRLVNEMAKYSSRPN